jgi:hypothetical protein
VIKKLFDSTKSVILLWETVLYERDVSLFQSSDEHHTLLVMDIVIRDSMIDHEVLSSQTFNLVQEAACVVTMLTYEQLNTVEAA